MRSTCHPPCEDVSWNTAFQHPSQSPVVILLVRMWVEISSIAFRPPFFSSSSLWGCELKYCFDSVPAAAVRSSSLWGCELKCCNITWIVFLEQVILLVRMWVEMPSRSWLRLGVQSHPPCEDVSWNLSILLVYGFSHSHPPCEDVSWNASTTIQRINSQNVILLVRMWVEILMLQS